MNAPRTIAALLLGSALLTACPEDAKKPLGGTCGGDDECAEGLCLSGLCLDPEADNDGDSLINRIESALGTNPVEADSDGDGTNDGAEIGDVETPVDTDGDGRPDAVESNQTDTDTDCVVDERDPDDDAPEIDPQKLAALVCKTEGACGAEGASVTASCPDGGATPTPACDYAGVPGYQADETLCDGADNDCDGATDERFVAGGSVTFDGGPLAADAGKVLGDTCGAGACAGGTVVCAAGGEALACSTGGNAGPLTCAADNDCNGAPDEGQVADPIATELAGCTDHYMDADGDGAGAGAAECLCAPSGGYAVTVAGDCAPDDENVHPGAAAICGVDADCDEALVDAGEPCDDGNALDDDGCSACVATTLHVPSNGETPSDLVTARLANGGFVLAWDDGYYVSESYAGRSLVFFDAAGREVARYEDFEAGASDIGYGLAVAALRGGGAVFGQWRMDQETGGFRFEVQRYDDAGVAVGNPVIIGGLTSSGAAYAIEIVPTSTGAYAVKWLDYSDGTYLVVRFVDADDKPQPETIAFTDQSFGDTSALGFDDGDVLLAWRTYNPQTFESSVVARRYLATGEPAGDVFPLAPGATMSFQATKLAHGPGAGQWALFFSEDRPGEPSSITAAGYLVFDANDAVTGPATYLQEDDTDGCPYGLVGGFLATGEAYAAFEDGECGSPVRGWLATDGDVVDLALTTPEREDTNYLVAAPGTDVVFFHTYRDPSDATLSGIYLDRFAADGTRIFVGATLER